MTRVGAVIPVGPLRDDNLWQCLAYLARQVRLPDEVVVVFDGAERRDEWGHPPRDFGLPLEYCTITIPHAPGMEQPRNVGVEVLHNCDAVWFLDSDILVAEGALDSLVRRWQPGTVVMGPYDWMDKGATGPQPGLYNDPRWPMFHEARWAQSTYFSRGELNVGLGCFSGNLLWDIPRFTSLGGFWNDLHHGRCEDGELGLRAVAEGVPLACDPWARGWHMGHEVNVPLILERNTRDVPMLNARHPWVQDAGLRLEEQDGIRFDQICSICGEQVNTLLYWKHKDEHLSS